MGSLKIWVILLEIFSFRYYPYYNDQLISQLRQLIDNYAAKGDELLEYYAANLLGDMEKLASLLTTDLGNLNVIKN